MLLRHPRGHASAPVAALGHVASVAQALHEYGPRFCNTRQAPPAFGGLVREPEAGERRHDDVESLVALAAVSRGIGQRTHDLEEFHNRARPPMRQEDRERM